MFFSNTPIGSVLFYEVHHATQPLAVYNNYYKVIWKRLCLFSKSVVITVGLGKNGIFSWLHSARTHHNVTNAL